MAVSLTHSFTSAKADDQTAASDGQVLPSHWNAEHTLTAAANTVLARAAATSGAVSEVALSASQLVGRGASGDVAAISLGTNLSMSGATLNAAGGSTDLTYTAATRLLESSTGTDVTLPLFSSGDAGLAPASGGGTTNFLRADGSWAAPSGGSGTLDNLTATSAPTVNDDTGDGYAVGSLWLWAARGLMWQCVSATAGAARWEMTFERSRATTSIIAAMPDHSNSFVNLGIGTPQATGTATGRTPATTNYFQSLPRLGYVTGTGANAEARFGYSGSRKLFWRGNAAGLGGFRVVLRFGISDAVFAAGRLFVGLDSDGTAGYIAVDPSTKTNIIAIACDAGDTTLQLMHNDGSGTATKTSLGASFPANTIGTDVYAVHLWAGANDSGVNWRVVRENTGDVASGRITTDLPSSTTFMSPAIARGNAATGVAVAFDMFSFYGEPQA